MHAGEDATEDYDDIGHSKHAMTLLQSLLIGRLEKS
jgi:hypothetical protein